MKVEAKRDRDKAEEPNGWAKLKTSTTDYLWR
jgi:hypothetical protein